MPMRRYTEMVSVVFRERDLNKVKELASCRDVSVSCLIRSIVSDYLRKLEEKKGGHNNLTGAYRATKYLTKTEDS